MAPHDHHDPDHTAQTADERAARRGDVASQALNEALGVSFRLLKLAMVLVVGLFLTSGVFVVKAEERAFVLRFGKLVTDSEGQAKLGPGIHFAWPFLIDEVVRFPVQRKLSLTIKDFWYAEGATERGAAAPRIEPGRAGYSLTGDANILHSIWGVEYQIEDPVKLFRHLADPVEIAALDPKDPQGAIPDLLRTLLNSAVIRTMATFRVDDAIGGRRGALEIGVADSLRSQLRRLDVGIVVTKFTLDKIAVPLQTKAAFDEVNAAVYQSQTVRDRASAYAEGLTTRATGQGDRLISEAKQYSSRVEKQAEADADYMDQLLAAATNPEDPVPLEVFLQQRLTEVIENVLFDADEVFVIDPGHPSGRTEVRLHLNRDPKAVQDNIRRRRKVKEAARNRARGPAPTETGP